jgi:hypothetical protein
MQINKNTKVKDRKDWARGLDGLKNRSEKCEGLARGDRWVKELE